MPRAGIPQRSSSSRKAKSLAQVAAKAQAGQPPQAGPQPLPSVLVCELTQLTAAQCPTNSTNIQIDYWYDWYDCERKPVDHAGVFKALILQCKTRWDMVPAAGSMVQKEPCMLCSVVPELIKLTASFHHEEDNGRNDAGEHPNAIKVGLHTPHTFS